MNKKSVIYLKDATISDLVKFLNNCDQDAKIFDEITIINMYTAPTENDSFIMYRNMEDTDMNNDPAKQKVDMEKLQESYDDQELISKRHYEVIYECTLRNIRSFFARYKDISNRKVFINGSNDIRLGFDPDGNIILSDAYKGPKTEDDGLHAVGYKPPLGYGAPKHLNPEEYVPLHCEKPSDFYKDSLDRRKELFTLNRKKKAVKNRKKELMKRMSVYYPSGPRIDFMDDNDLLALNKVDVFADEYDVMSKALIKREKEEFKKFQHRMIVHEIKRIQISMGLSHKDTIKALMDNKAYRKEIKKLFKNKKKNKKKAKKN